MLQGMTAHYLACSTYPLKAGDVALVHAAAGGVGLLLCQIGTMRGARVLGTTSTPEKAALAREAGAAQTIDYTREDFAAEARRATGGRGVDVVYDSVGRTTWEKSLDSLARRGMLVLFGQSSGPVPPLDPLILSQKGSLYLTRPTLGHYTATWRSTAGRRGSECPRQSCACASTESSCPEAAAAHSALEGRATTGKVLLVP
jgi:NADPH2:quinone reductase